MTIDLDVGFDDPYSYAGTHVLRNRLGLRDAETLEAFEVEITTLRAEEPLPGGGFDPAHYRAIHHHLFQDVYEWAGEYRNVGIGKGRHEFCYPDHIPARMEALFATLCGGEVFSGMDRVDFVIELSRFLSELNVIHPFRDGNGRSQMAFVWLIGATAGHPLALERLERSTFLPAMIESFSGKRQALLAEIEKLLI